MQNKKAKRDDEQTRRDEARDASQSCDMSKNALCQVELFEAKDEFALMFLVRPWWRAGEDAAELVRIANTRKKY
jgi:hypothetical protein